MLIRHADNYRWEEIPVQGYKGTEGPKNFKGVTRQVLFEGAYDLPIHLRYFELEAGGYSSLEYHQHAHLVFIERGEADAILGDAVHHVAERDVLVVPPNTWHQFQANYGQPMGFLCTVNQDRDKPTLPTEGELEQLKQDPEIGPYIKG